MSAATELAALKAAWGRVRSEVLAYDKLVTTPSPSSLSVNARAGRPKVEIRANVTVSAVGNLYNAVTQGGIDNTGSTSVTSAILNAITVYKNSGYSGLYFPAGTYLLSSALTVPGGTVLAGPAVSALGSPTWGCNTPSAWLRGPLRFSGSSSFNDLKIGNKGISGGYGVENVGSSSTNNTTFSRCEFAGSYYSTTPASCMANVYLHGACHDITFTDCTVGDSDYNGFTINSYNGDIYNILLTRSHVLHADRMGYECTDRGGVGAFYHDNNITNCLFEMDGSEGVSYDGYPQSNHCLIENVVIKGGGNGDRSEWTWTQGFEINGNTGFTVNNLTVYLCYGIPLNLNGPSTGVNCGHVFTNCTIDQSVRHITRSGVASDVNGPSSPFINPGGLKGAVFDNCTFNSGHDVKSRFCQMPIGADNNNFSTCHFTGYDNDNPTDHTLRLYDWVDVRDRGAGNTYPSGTSFD